MNACSRHRPASLTQALSARNNVTEPIRSLPVRFDVDDQTPPTALWKRLSDSFGNHASQLQFAGTKVLAAVSGGADSVAMLRLLLELWQRAPGHDPGLLAVAHYNHGLRGEASDQDQQFVCGLCHSLGLLCVTQTASRDQQPSNEAALRSARYAFLQATAAKIGARCLVVAHTADDNVETVLHHLFRGTGTAGLAGMATHRSFGDDGVLVRPMLTMWRDELRKGLVEIGQTWREDASNLDVRYQRNWIRGTLLPLIRERYPLADRAVVRAIQSQSGYRDWIQLAANLWIETNVSREAHGVDVRRGEVDLVTLSAAVRLLWDHMRWPRQAMTASHLRRFHAALTSAEPVAFTLPGDVQCRATSDKITLHRGR